MSYTKEDINFILFNNRSSAGVVQNFLFEQKWNGEYLIALDDMSYKYKQKWKKWKTTIIKTDKLNLNSTDIIVKPYEIKKLTSNILESNKQLLFNNKYNFELNWLKNRGFTLNIIKKWKLGSLQYIVDTCTNKELDVLGITTHPMLSNILNTDITGGGIIIPHFKNNKLFNCTNRRINDNGKLKYNQAVPDMSLYGLNECKSHDTLYLTEGIFDMIALHEQGKNAISVSAAVWSSLQLYQLLETDVKNIIIFADNDKVGLSSAGILKDILNYFDINIKIIISNINKDACEHFITNKHTFNETSEINLTSELIESKEEVQWDLVEYLQNRSF
jgi:hypothetical protein